MAQRIYMACPALTRPSPLCGMDGKPLSWATAQEAQGEVDRLNATHQGSGASFFFRSPR